MYKRAVGHRESVRHRTVWPRLRDAFGGLVFAYRQEPNLRFHLFAAACAFAAGTAVSLRGWEVAYLAVTVALVLFAEMVNTAVERAVDFAANGRHHPLAAQAKEVAAGAVLLAAVHATLAAGFLFLIERGFGTTLHALVGLWHDRPWVYALPLLAGGLALLGGVSPDRSGTD